jgi:hypothetical protein
VVWLDPPAGRYFTLTDQEKKRPGEEVLLDQPHCAFIPHVATLFPSFYDGEKQVKTGQKFVVKNSAAFAHTVQSSGSLDNDKFTRDLLPNGGKVEMVLNP